jgi:hypothetical protein
LTCSNCGAPIPAENINIQKTLAVCPECATVFDFSTAISPVAAPPTPSKRKRRKIKQPEYITIQPAAQGLDLVYKWGIKAETSTALVLMGLWAAVAVIVGVLGTVVGREPGALLATLLIGGFPFYYFLCLFTNATRCLVNDEQVQVRTGPLWFWGYGHATLDTAEVQAVYWELGEDEDDDSGGYTVYARLEDGGRKKLLEGILKSDAEFIAQEMNAALYEQELGDLAHLTDSESESEAGLIEPPAQQSRRTG